MVVVPQSVCFVLALYPGSRCLGTRLVLVLVSAVWYGAQQHSLSVSFPGSSQLHNVHNEPGSETSLASEEVGH